MRIILTAALLTGIAVLSNCSKSTTESAEGVVGKWRLSEYFVDPGNGSGTWQPASQLSPKHVEFKRDGRLVADAGVMILPHSDRYEILSDSTMSISKTGSPDEYMVYYRKDGKRLTLNFTCFEGCGVRLVRAK